MLGGQIIASETLSRFFALHVFVLPGSVIAIVSLHLRMVLSKGINEYPVPGMVVRRQTYDKEYAAIIKKEGVPFFPKAIDKDIIAAAIVIGGIVTCACVFGPKGPSGPPDPLQINASPAPDFWFLWIYSIAALMPEQIETVALLGGPAVIGLILVALPFFNGTGEKSWRRRPVAVLIVLLTWIAIGMLTYLGATSPWSPVMNAWSAQSTPDAQILHRSPLQLQGAVVLQYKQCRNCHSIDGLGGERGPDLSDVSMRLTRPQLTRQVVQGGGNMPAYGQNLSPSEVEALVDYMATLVPAGVPPARDFTLQRNGRN
jgi:ubiquinol-cytochrome c reductase cytochrome b subunit